MTDQENQSPLLAQEASDAIAVQPGQKEKQGLLDQLHAQQNATEELSDEQLAATTGGIGELGGLLHRSASEPVLRPGWP